VGTPDNPGREPPYADAVRRIGRRRRTALAAAVATTTLAVVLTACGGGETPARPDGTSVAASPGPSSGPDNSAAGGVPDDVRVLVITVDGLGAATVGPETTPAIDRLLEEGAGTRNARTEVEQTETLPNHTSMVTGRPISAAGGHGVTWNTDTDRPLRPGVDSVFTAVADAGGASAAFMGKAKFDIWYEAWPEIDAFLIDEDQASLVDAAAADLTSHERDLTFVHLAGPDHAGHETGWGSPAYLAAVAQADADVERIVAAADDASRPAGGTVVVLTADHGGVPGDDGHAQPGEPANYTIPFVVWGAGVADAGLYELNPDYADPGTGRPSYAGTQPVRNGDVANLVTALLGLPPVPGSRIGRGQDLDVVE
jgi:hypothetical protein